MKIERDYYEIKGGAVRAAYDRWLATRLAQQEARNAICKEFGASGTYANSRGVEGLVFEEGAKVPDNWKSIDRTTYAPRGGTKAAKEARARLRNLPLVDASDFQEEVLGKGQSLKFFYGMAIHYMTFENIGSRLILTVPNIKSDPWTPPDAETVPLKTSEYWLIKESTKATL